MRVVKIVGEICSEKINTNYNTEGSIPSVYTIYYSIYIYIIISIPSRRISFPAVRNMTINNLTV
jgi:hypothetical protein